MSSRIRRLSGPTPSSGLIAPPSTWYRPRNSPVFSIATTSLGSSTTHRTSSLRRGSLQIRHRSDSATLKQVAQNRTNSFTRVSAAASRVTSVGSADSTWNAMRCALLGPIPGSRPSSSMRSWIAPSYITGSERQAAEAAGQRPHLLLGERAHRLRRVAQRREHEVLQRLHVVRIDCLRIDLHRLVLTGAGDRHGDQTAAGRTRHLRLGQLGLRGGELALQLHQLLEVGLSTGAHGLSSSVKG